MDNIEVTELEIEIALRGMIAGINLLADSMIGGSSNPDRELVIKIIKGVKRTWKKD